MRKRLFSRRSATTVALAFGAMIVGVAFASWTANGTGTGKAKSITAQESAVSGQDGAADLYPGYADGDLHLTVDNPNPYPVRFTSASFGTVASSNEALCPAAKVNVDATASGLTIDVPANSTGTDAVIADVVGMAADAPDGCQGKSFTIDVTLSGTQV